MMATRARTAFALGAVATYLVAHFSRTALFAIPGYADAIENAPTLLRHLEQPARWVAIVLVGLRLVNRIAPRKAWGELGLNGRVGQAFALAFIATLPMLIPGLLRGEIDLSTAPLYLLFMALIWPIGEEVLYRGYLFRQLHRRAKWRFWTAALFSSLLFGLAHLGNAIVQRMPLTDQLGTVAMIAFLSVLGAWFFARWDDNLWVMVFLHALMNLYWSLFALAENPLGGMGANLMRLGVVVLGIALTLNRRRLPKFFQTRAPART